MPNSPLESAAIRLAEAFCLHRDMPTDTVGDVQAVRYSWLGLEHAECAYRAAKAQPARDPLEELAELLESPAMTTDEARRIEKARALCAEAIRRAK